MTRRKVFKYLGYFFLTGLGSAGVLCASRLLPRPPKKIVIKEDQLQKKKLFVIKEVFLVRQGKRWLALSRRCPHLGCLVGFDNQKREFVCPCHQSRFDLSGRYLAGPAKKDLLTLKIKKIEGGWLLEIPS